MLRSWKRSSVLFLFFFFAAASPTLADCSCDFLDAVTFNKQYPPGSLSVRYGGLRGRLSDEAGRRLIDIWERQIYITAPNYSDYLIERRKMYNAYIDMRAGGKWWTRNWMQSLPESKGGAPSTPIVIWKGLSNDLFRLGPLYINNKFKFKIRSYSFDLTEPESAYQWRLKIKPQVKVGLRDLIRYARLTLIFTYSYRGTGLISVGFFSGYSMRNGVILGFQVSMLRW